MAIKIKGIDVGTFARRFWSYVEVGADSECWEWTGARNPDGYGVLCIGRKLIASAHRISWALAHSRSMGKGKLACHTCDNKGCVNPAHIYEGTHRSNHRDASERGRTRSARGQLSLERARQLRQERAAGASTLELCAQYGISRTMLHKVLSGRSWPDPSAHPATSPTQANRKQAST